MLRSSSSNDGVIPDLLCDWRRGTPLPNCIGCGCHLIHSAHYPVYTYDNRFSLYAGFRTTRGYTDGKPPRLELPQPTSKTTQTPGGPISLELHRKMQAKSRVAVRTATPPPPPRMENIIEKPTLELPPSIFKSGVVCGHHHQYRKLVSEATHEATPDRKLKAPIVRLQFV